MGEGGPSSSRGWGQSFSPPGRWRVRVPPAGASRRQRIQPIVRAPCSSRSSLWPSRWLRPEPAPTGRSKVPSARSRAASWRPGSATAVPSSCGTRTARSAASLPARSFADSRGSCTSARWSSRPAGCASSRPRRSRGPGGVWSSVSCGRTAPGPGSPSGIRGPASRRRRATAAPADPRNSRADAREPPACDGRAGDARSARARAPATG